MITSPSPIPTELLALPGDKFVAKAIEILSLDTVSVREQHAMSEAIYRGVNKTRVWEALSARVAGRPIMDPTQTITGLVRPDDDIAMLEVLMDHSPEDDATFIGYCFYRLVGRDPNQDERLRLRGMIVENLGDRREVVFAILDAAKAEGRTPTVAPMTGDQAFSIIGKGRIERSLLIKRLNAKDYLVTEGGLRAAELRDDGLHLQGGLALVGPKSPMRPGLWQLMIDWAQDEEAAIVVEVTANGGMEKMASVTLVGTTLCKLEFRVLPDHLVSEILIYGIRSGKEGNWLVRPGEVSVQWVGE